MCSAVKCAPELHQISELLEVNICKQADMLDDMFAEVLNSERCASVEIL